MNFCCFLIALTSFVYFLEQIYCKFYSQLVSALPMKDSIFLCDLVKLLPYDLKDVINSKPTQAEASTCFLDKMIGPTITSGNNEPFYLLLTIMEKSDHINLKKLAKYITEEIESTQINKSTTGKNL